MTAAAQPAPHAAHDPRFGGLFATAAGDSLHIEASWSEQRRVRLFVTDATGSPISSDRMRDIDARAVTGDRESPFVLLEADNYFEARIPTLALPAAITVRFKPGASGREERLTFSFREFSAAYILGSTAPTEIPTTLKGILDALTAERKGVQSIVEREQFQELLGSEDRIRDLVLAIDPYLDRLPPMTRRRVEETTRAVIRSCWLLHTAMDYGIDAQRGAAVEQLDEMLDRALAELSGLMQ